MFDLGRTVPLARAREVTPTPEEENERGTILVMVLILICVLGGSIAAVLSLQYTSTKAQREVTGAGDLGLRNVTVSGDSAIDLAITKLRQRSTVGVDGGSAKCNSTSLADKGAAFVGLPANPWEPALTQWLATVPAQQNVRPPITVFCTARSRSGANSSAGGENYGTVLTTLGGSTTAGQDFTLHGTAVPATTADLMRKKSPFCDDFAQPAYNSDFPCEAGLEVGRGVQTTSAGLVAEGDPTFSGSLINSNSSVVANSFNGTNRKLQVVGPGKLRARQSCVGFDSAAATPPHTTNIQSFIMTNWDKVSGGLVLGEAPTYPHRECDYYDPDRDPWTGGTQHAPINPDPMDEFHHELWQATDCGTLPADHAVDYTQKCGDITATAPTSPTTGAVSSLGTPTPPTTNQCYEGFVKFEPGYYSSASTLNQFFDAAAPAACKNAVLYFSPTYGTNKPSYETGPGVYYFDFTGTDKSWGPPTSGKLPITIVGGTPPTDSGNGFDSNGFQAWNAESCVLDKVAPFMPPTCPLQPRKRLRFQAVAFSGDALRDGTGTVSETNEMRVTTVSEGRTMKVSLPKNGDKSTMTLTKPFTPLTNAKDPYSTMPLVNFQAGDGIAAGANGDNPLKDGIAIEVAYHAPLTGSYSPGNIELVVSAGSGTCTLKLPSGNYLAGNGSTGPIHVDLTNGCLNLKNSSTGIPIPAVESGSFPFGVNPNVATSWTVQQTHSTDPAISELDAIFTMKQNGAATGPVVAEFDGVEVYVNYKGPPAPDFPNACDPAPGAKGVQLLFGGESRIYFQSSGLAAPNNNNGLNFEMCGSRGVTTGGSSFGPTIVGLSDHEGTSPECATGPATSWQSCGQVGAPWVREGSDLVDTNKPCTISSEWNATSDCTTLKKYVAKSNSSGALASKASWATSNAPLTMSFTMPNDVVANSSIVEAIEFQIKHAEGGDAADAIARVDIEVNKSGSTVWNTGTTLDYAAVRTLMNNAVDKYRCGGGIGSGGATGLAADAPGICPGPSSTSGGIPVTNSSTLTTWRWGGRMDTKPTQLGVTHDPTKVNPAWPWERAIVDSSLFGNPATLQGATVTFTITPKTGAPGKFASLEFMNMRIIYRPPGTLRPLTGCLTVKPAYNWDGTMMGTDRDWATGTSGGGNGIVSKGPYDPNMYPSTCALVTSNGPRIHFNGSLYAPTAAIDLVGSDNDSSFNSNAMIARHIAISGWTNSVTTSLGSTAIFDGGHRKVTLYAWRTDTSPKRLIAEVDVDLDDSTTSGQTTVVTRWVRYE